MGQSKSLFELHEDLKTFEHQSLINKITIALNLLDSKWITSKRFEEMIRKIEKEERKASQLVEVECTYCGKNITVSIPLSYRRKGTNWKSGHSCNECIPENSNSRNGIDESNCVEWKGK